jgi:hypothetical protein
MGDPAMCREYNPADGQEIKAWPVVETWFLGRFIACSEDRLPSLWWRVKLRLGLLFKGLGR